MSRTVDLYRDADGWVNADQLYVLILDKPLPTVRGTVFGPFAPLVALEMQDRLHRVIPDAQSTVTPVDSRAVCELDYFLDKRDPSGPIFVTVKEAS